jgi:two-component system copper resistance phosphate regulon response regulator CusR
MRILIVEDERKLAATLAKGLGEHGYEARVAGSGEEAAELLGEASFDLVLLDLMLPGRGGMEVLREMRRKGSGAAALILTSRDGVEDRVAGLDAGADDYLVKPFAFPELLARVRALLRRTEPKAGPQVQLADLVVDRLGRTATRSGVKLELTVREFDLLEYLLLHRGTVVSREMLAKEVWKETLRFTPLDNVIDVQIARLRRRLDGPFEKKLLQTVRGVGFVLREE